MNKHGGDEHPARRLGYDLHPEPERLPVPIEDAAPEILRRVEQDGGNERDRKPHAAEQACERRARQQRPKHEHHSEPDLPTPHRGDHRSPVRALRLPLGDVSPKRLGCPDPQHLHGQERSRPQQRERREPRLAEDVGRNALESEGKHPGDAEGDGDVQASRPRALAHFEWVRHQVSGYRFQVCSHRSKVYFVSAGRTGGAPCRTRPAALAAIPEA